MTFVLETSGLRRDHKWPVDIQLSFCWPRRDGLLLLSFQVMRCHILGTHLRARTRMHAEQRAPVAMGLASSLWRGRSEEPRLGQQVSSLPRGSWSPEAAPTPASPCCCCHCVQFASLQYPPSIQVLHPVRASRWGPEQFTAAKPQETLPNFIAPSLWPPSSPGELQSRRPVSSASDNPVFAKGNRHYLRGPPCWE